jgi:RNA-directed DNA polymerase
MAAKRVLEPIFEADFCEHAYGFRPKRSAHDAVDAVADALWSGHVHVIDADRSKSFDTIPHAQLRATVAERISDGAVLALIKQWLKAPVVEDDDGVRRTNGGGKGNRRGTPQGGVIAPLLSNLDRPLLDRIWERHELEQRDRAQLVRYADDGVIVCAGEVEAPMAALRHVLGRLDLRLNKPTTRGWMPARRPSTRLVSASTQGTAAEAANATRLWNRRDGRCSGSKTAPRP